jgi:hypothetical protein
MYDLKETAKLVGISLAIVLGIIFGAKVVSESHDKTLQDWKDTQTGIQIREDLYKQRLHESFQNGG